MKRNRTIAATSLVAISSFLGLLAAATLSGALPEEDSLSAALCPLVYQLDQSPSSSGYRYTFFGNAFFINEQGYLLTAAHVLDTFRDGGQPYILVNRPNSPARLLGVATIPVDSGHDVAILRATPNPFSGRYRVAFLPLSILPATSGLPVVALSLHPRKPRHARTFEAPLEDRSEGKVLSFESTQLDKAADPAEVFLLSHSVELGQSGSPVLAFSSGAVVGMVEGRWLRSSAVAITEPSSQHASNPGAAIPIAYAVSLLQRNGVSWHPASGASNDSGSAPKP